MQREIDKEKHRIIHEQIIPWIMMFASNKGSVKNFQGQTYSWTGVLFEGSPRDVFWGRYIEPFLEDSTVRLIEMVSKECRENRLNIRTELDTLSQHLRGMYARVYKEMADADQKMRGNGYPENVQRVDVSQEISTMNHYLDMHIAMDIAKHKSRTSIKHQFIDSLKEKAIEKITAGVVAAIIFILSLIFAKQHLMPALNWIKASLG